MVTGPSIVFTRKAIAGETKFRYTGNLCRAIVGIDASQLYPFSMCQEMATGLYTRSETDAKKKKLMLKRSNTRTSKVGAKSKAQKAQSIFWKKT